MRRRREGERDRTRRWMLMRTLRTVQYRQIRSKSGHTAKTKEEEGNKKDCNLRLVMLWKAAADKIHG